MSQPKHPRKFKFVGGPSRKRRRCANPSAGDDESTSTNNVQKMMQPVFAVQNTANNPSNPEGNDGYAAPDAASGNVDAATTTRPSVTSLINEPSVPPTALLQDRSTFIGQQMATDALEAALSYDDPFNLSGARFHLATSTNIDLDNDAAFDISLSSPEDCVSVGHRPPVTDDLPWEGSSDSTEDILRETGPELEDHVSISGDISDTLYGLFAQCKTALARELEEAFDARPTDIARQMTGNSVYGL